MRVNCYVALILAVSIVHRAHCDSLDCYCSSNGSDYWAFDTIDGTQRGKFGYEVTASSEEGSFFLYGVDEQDQAKLERSDIRDGQPGVNLHLIVRLVNSLTSEPLNGVYVHVWQANALGYYSGLDNSLGRKDKRSVDGQTRWVKRNDRDPSDDDWYESRRTFHDRRRRPDYQGSYDRSDYRQEPTDPPKGAATDKPTIRDETFNQELNETKGKAKENQNLDGTLTMNVTDPPHSQDNATTEKVMTSYMNESTATAEAVDSKESTESESNPYTMTTVSESTEVPVTTELPDKPENGTKRFHRQKPINNDRFLRGYQGTNHQGDVSFITIIPGWYKGRSQHIHIEVYLDKYSSDNVTYVGQLFLPADDQLLMDRIQSTNSYNQPINMTHNEDDSVFKESRGEELTLILEPVGNSFQAIVTIGIDPTETIQTPLDQWQSS